MPDAPSIDTSVITPVNGAAAPPTSAIDPGFSAPMPEPPAPVPVPQPVATPTPVPAPTVDQTTSPAPSTPAPENTFSRITTSAPPPEAFALKPDPNPMPMTVDTQPAKPATAPITTFPEAEQMMADLQASGTLTAASATADESEPATVTQNFTPGQLTSQPPKPPTAPPSAIHLANTIQTFHRPTAEQLLDRAGSMGKKSRHIGAWLIIGTIVLGAIAWIVYSQMRMTDQSAQEVMTNGFESAVDSSNP